MFLFAKKQMESQARGKRLPQERERQEPELVGRFRCLQFAFAKG